MPDDILKRALLRTRWQDIKKHGYPPRENDPFAGDRYSYPVLAGNEVTGQVALTALVYDYDEKGWLPFDMPDGPGASEHETQHVTHWALWPKCNLICAD